MLLEEIPSQIIQPSKRKYTVKYKSRQAHLNEPKDGIDQPQSRSATK